MTVKEKGMPALLEVVNRTEYLRPGLVGYQTALRFENGWTYVRQQRGLQNPKETLVQNKMPVKDEEAREKMLDWCRLTAETDSFFHRQSSRHLPEEEPGDPQRCNNGQ